MTICLITYDYYSFWKSHIRKGWTYLPQLCLSFTLLIQLSSFSFSSIFPACFQRFENFLFAPYFNLFWKFLVQGTVFLLERSFLFWPLLDASESSLQERKNLVDRYHSIKQFLKLICDVNSENHIYKFDGIVLQEKTKSSW